jgi:hypothetical protein
VRNGPRLTEKSPKSMVPHVEEYQRLKNRAKAAAVDPTLRSEVAREISQYVISQLRSFGASDGALCAWANLDGYEAHANELLPIQEQGRYRSLRDRMWSLARQAGIAHESGSRGFGTSRWRISSELLLRANQSIVWRLTKDFRATIEAEKKKKEPRSDQPVFYKPPVDHSAGCPRRLNRWV